MWVFTAPSVLSLVAIALLPSALAKPYPTHVDEPRELNNATQLERRDCGSGIRCGYYGQLCCTGGEVCFTDANNLAQCGAAAAAATAAAPGGWVTYTSTWVETGYVTRTSVWSTYVAATVQAAPTPTCTGAQSPCGVKCCDSGYYCLTSGQCALYGGGSSGGIIGTLTPSAPLRRTSSGLIIITATGTPTATVPFETPIPTGVNGTLVPANGGGGGLSGGAIAGIVIGVLLGILLLLLLCLFCCARALFDTVMAIFGLGKKRKHTHEETYIEEHHHSSGAGSGRRWHGQGPSRPSRPPKKTGGLGGALGIGALLGGLAIALGLKRRHDRHHDDKSTTISGSSYYTDYTSSSSASSSDRHTRHTRHSSRR
ncbi:uncharacterized protein BDR25DRAFT_124477 [Lindgomyces ingoldianus]|uniref:Uncharacterized protein n=1 Tax=Lindgomyces ingoldianus TaxID=673940 RepID=A0ACB6R4E2_9PLEO|nr:uncharacterized protein BDR25DRAFT_124477 [Lindgomyces ingoldianus]KAF2473693.1 hypothetical protein BDR25DRAFT_124477 [Lindgomyces ingoldianus]